MVTISAPSTNTARHKQPETGLPSTSTVQQPQSPCPQLSRAPVKPNCVCSISTSEWCGMASTCTGRPFRVNAMRRASAISGLLKRPALLGADRAQNSLRRKWQLRQPDADRVLDRVRDRRRNAERGDFARAFRAEWAVALDVLDGFIQQLRHVVNAGNFVIRHRGVDDLAAFEMHFFEHGEAELHQRAA